MYRYKNNKKICMHRILRNMWVTFKLRRGES
jgi:hypothetical protein